MRRGKCAWVCVSRGAPSQKTPRLKEMDSDPSSDEEGECCPRPANAFDVLMAPPAKKAKVDEVEPILIAVVYIRWLKWIDPSAPLYGCPYVGQAIRIGNTAEEVALTRWKQENYDATRHDKRLGLMHELKVHGPEAFDDQIVEWKKGPRSEVQKWADEREVALIAEHGFPLRDPSARCKQTLNLTKGGKGNVNFESRDASRTVAWMKFQDDMEEYIECYGTSLVPRSYVNSVSGHRLGEQLSSVRKGVLWRGHPDQAERIEWIEALPDWAWNVMQTDEWREGLSKRGKKQFESQEARDAQSERSKVMWANADEETRAEWSRKMSEAQSTPEAKAAASERGKKQFESQEARDELSERAKAQWANADEKTRAEWRRKQSEARWTPEYKAAASERGKKQFESQDARDAQSKRAKAQAEREAAEGKKSLAERGKEWYRNSTQVECDERNRKISEAHSTPEARAAASKRAKKQFESQEVRDELSERAKAQWTNADEETRAEWSRKMSEAQSTPEARAAASERGKKRFESQDARDAQSERGKAQAVREAAEGKKSLAERGKATRTENWTKEQREAVKIKRASTVANRTQAQRDAISAKKTAAAAAKRATVLAALPESERPKKQAEFDRNDLKEANRRGKANALLQLPSYAEKGYQWCYNNLTQAAKDAVVFFQDPSGVWCARACGDQGAGSSSEHARTVEETAAEELEAEVAEAPEEPADLVPRVAEMVAGA